MKLKKNNIILLTFSSIALLTIFLLSNQPMEEDVFDYMEEQQF